MPFQIRICIDDLKMPRTSLNKHVLAVYAKVSLQAAISLAQYTSRRASGGRAASLAGRLSLVCIV